MSEHTAKADGREYLKAHPHLQAQTALRVVFRDPHGQVAYYEAHPPQRARMRWNTVSFPQREDFLVLRDEGA